MFRIEYWYLHNWGHKLRTVCRKIKQNLQKQRTAQDLYFIVIFKEFHC